MSFLRYPHNSSILDKLTYCAKPQNKFNLRTLLVTKYENGSSCPKKITTILAIDVRQEMRDERRETGDKRLGDRSWETRDEKQETGEGRWKMGDGRLGGVRG